MNAEEEQIEKCGEIKALIRKYVGLVEQDYSDQEYELNNAADAIWRHVIVPMCRT